MVRAVCLSSAIRKCQSNLFINKKQVYLTRISTKFYSSDGSTGDGNVVSIGSVSKKLSVPQNPEFVPKNYLPKDLAKVELDVSFLACYLSIVSSPFFWVFSDCCCHKDV